VLKRQGIRKEVDIVAGGSGGLKARSARMREPRGRRARGTGQWDSGKVGFGSWLCEDGTGETALRKLILQMGDWQTKVLSFPALGATSEKFILAIVLLDALLNGQGHERLSKPLHGRSALYGAPSRAEVTIDPPRQD
jgi:hypothetical protein